MENWGRYKTKFDFETTLLLYNDGVGRKYIPYWAPSLRDSAQYGIYFLPTSRHYNRGTQRIVSVEYLFGRPVIASNFRLGKCHLELS